MLGALEFVTLVVFWGGIAIVAHELAHAVAAVLVGRPIEAIDWRTLDVYWLLPESGPGWRDYVIGWAPLVSGALVALLAASTTVSLSVPQWIALLFYGLHGGLDDLQVSTTTPGALQGKD